MSSNSTIDDLEVSQGKSIDGLWVEAAWLAVHSALALSLMFAAIVAFSFTRPNAEDVRPKLIGTAIAFFVPMIFGLLIAWRQQNVAAKQVWISGLVFFAIACVWVLDLPTGNGLCDHCLALEKLRRTFFDIRHGSGLLSGQGLMIGAWIPLSLFGYALGAKLGLK
jgi:hypothetical protein